MNEITILLAEDDSFISGMYLRKFESLGWQVLHAKDGQEALTFLEQQVPSIILLDIMMPNVDGWQVLQTIEQKPEWRMAPVVMLSNLGSQDDIDRGMHLGARDYLIKAHVTPTDVADKVREILQIQ